MNDSARHEAQADAEPETSPGGRVTPPGESVVSDAGDSFESLLREVANAPSMELGVPLADGDEQNMVAGRFRVRERLGAGGMGIVHLARDTQLNRDVAVKVHRATIRKAEIRRLRREAQSMAGLNHQNVLTVYDVGTHKGALYIAMEYAPGGTLRQRLKADDLSWREVVQLFVATGEGLQAAHEAGIVHRDFKPDNVLLATDAAPKVADFGLASLPDQSDEERFASDESDDEHTSGSAPRLTHTGAVLGTPAYMAPEQLGGLDVDARADQFAFCVSLFEGLFGRRPFPGETLQEISAHVTSGEIHYPPVRRRIPRPLQAVLERGLQVDPAARWPDMQTLLATLRRVAQRPRAPIYLGAGAAAVAGLYALSLATDEDDCAASLRIQEVWGGKSKQEIEASFHSAAPEFAEAAWEQTEAVADSYVAELRQAWSAACAARDDRQPAASDRGLACLRARRGDMQALVEVLRHADAGTVASAVEAALGPPAVARCDSSSPDDQISDPDVAKKVAALRQDIATARVRRQAGQALAASDLAREATAEAQSLGYEPVIAAALFERGAAQLALGTIDGTVDLETAYFKAVEVGDDRLASTAASSLIRALAGDIEGSKKWYEAAVAGVERRGGDELAAATAARDLGMGYYAVGDVKMAAELIGGTVEAFEAAGDRRELAESLSLLGAVELRAGHIEDAEKYGRRALALAKEIYGERHPRIAPQVMNLADTLRGADKRQEALELSTLALELRTVSHGAESLGIVDALQGIAASSTTLGEHASAIPYQERAVAIRRGHNVDRATLARALGNLGNYYANANRYSEGLKARQEALALMETQDGTPGEVAILRAAVAQSYGNLGRDIEATDAMRRALESFEQSLGPDHPNLGLMHLNMALLCSKARRFEDGHASADEAKRIFTTSLPADHRNHSRVLAARTTLFAVAGEWHKAIEVGDAAVAGLEGHGGPFDFELVSVLRRRGAALVEVGRTREGIASQRRAVEIGTTKNTLPFITAKAQFELAQSLWNTGAHNEAREQAQGARNRVAHLSDEDGFIASVEAWLNAHEGPAGR